MAAPDAETQKRLADWFASLDPTVQRVLDQIYAEAPEAVSKVISGGSWTAGAEDAPLSEVLAGGEFGDREGLSSGVVDINPWPLTAGANARFSIPLFYQGSRDHPAFQTTVTWTAPSGATDTFTLDSDAIAPGGSTTLQFDISDLEQGEYSVNVDVNPGGAEVGAPPNGAGTHINYPIPLFVSSREQGADEQDNTTWSAAMGHLMPLISDLRGAPEYLRDGLNWLAALELEPDERTVLEQALRRADRIADLDADGVQRPQALDDTLTAIGVAANRAMMLSDDNKAAMFAALQELNELGF